MKVASKHNVREYKALEQGRYLPLLGFTKDKRQLKLLDEMEADMLCCGYTLLYTMGMERRMTKKEEVVSLSLIHISFLAKGHPSFQGSSRGDGERRCTSAEV